MCLISRDNKVYEAGYDILVYKRLNYGFDGFLRSPFLRAKYTLKRLVKAELGIDWVARAQARVHEGLHSYLCQIDISYVPLRYPAVIPKGAHFMIGRDDVVSTQLIVFPIDHVFPKGIGKADFSKHRVIRTIR
jgi:hypothetical protein